MVLVESLRKKVDFNFEENDNIQYWYNREFAHEMFKNNINKHCLLSTSRSFDNIICNSNLSHIDEQFVDQYRGK